MRTAGFFDSVSGGLYSKLAGAFGANVPQCSADYQFGQHVGLPYNVALAAVSGGGDVEADAVLANEARTLEPEIANTFMGGQYTSRVLTEDMIYYRSGRAGRPLGEFFSNDASVSEIQTRIDKAIPPVWPNGRPAPPDTGYAIKIPAGTTVYEGTVAPQGGFYLGGTSQTVILKPWAIGGVEVVRSWPLVK